MLEIKLPKDKKIGLAVSGGLDSMVMLRLAQKASANIVVINFEHGLRGEESIKDSQLVKQVCKDGDIPFKHFSLNVQEEQELTGDSMELCARNLRYKVFSKLLSAGEVDVIALAHHLDDQCETILMRTFRGTGIRGLRGITDSTHFIHPLIGYTKAQLLQYAKQNNIEYREDATNKDSEYTRNYIRNKIIPLITERYPSFNKSIIRLAEHCGEVEAYLQSQVAPYKEHNGVFSLPEQISSLHPLIIKYSIGSLLRAMGVYHDIENKHYDDLLLLAQKQNNKKIDLPWDITAYIENGKLTFTRGERREAFSQPFVAEKVYEHLGEEYIINKVAKRGIALAFDGDKLPKGTVVRTRQNGDIFKACNGRSKLLSDYLQQKRIPLRIRDSILLLAKGHTIYAILGIEISDLVKIDNNSINIYEIKKVR